jgi:hypothetical protein
VGFPIAAAIKGFIGITELACKILGKKEKREI